MSESCSKKTERPEIELQGAIICPGIGIGRVCRIDLEMPLKETGLAPERVEREQQRYNEAVADTRLRLREHVDTAHGDAESDTDGILEVHEAILGDESFHDRVRQRIASDLRRAEWSLWHEAAALIAQFNAMSDPYFRARGEDVRDMAHNVIGTLSGNHKSAKCFYKNTIPISRHLHVSGALFAHRNRATGFVSESSALLSHAAILLKGFEIPSVGAVKGLADRSRNGDRILVDGNEGRVILNPSEDTLARFRRKKREFDAREISVAAGCRTADGVRIQLMANIENPDQVSQAHSHKLDGIGLFRTEFMISPDGRIPGEEDQYFIYRKVIEKSRTLPVTIRTFDIGGDKPLGLSERCSGANPALGLRGIRRHLGDRGGELHTQLKAIMRASEGADVGILVPMVTTLGDILEVRERIETVKDELRASGMDFSGTIRFGAMIETPAAAAAVGRILDETDFVSIGTNDLLQYFMAADRDNERVASYNNPTDPAFLWLLKHIIDQARAVESVNRVTVCGEASSDPKMLPLLLDMGYESFSIPPVSSTIFRSYCSIFTREKHA